MEPYEWYRAISHHNGNQLKDYFNDMIFIETCKNIPKMIDDYYYDILYAAGREEKTFYGSKHNLSKALGSYRIST